MEYAAVSIVVLVVSYKMHRYAAGSLSILSPNPITYVFYYTLFLQTFIGSVLVVTNLDNHYVINRVSDDSSYYGWLSIQYVMVALPLGMIISKWMFLPGISMRSKLVSYQAAAVDLSAMGGKGGKYAIFLFTVVAVAASFYTFVKIGYLPLTRIMSVEADALASQRIEAARGFSGNIYIRNILALQLMPLLTYAWIVYFIKTKSVSDCIISILCAFLTINILIFDLSKSPIITFMLGIVWLISYASIKIKFIHLISTFILCAYALLFFYSVAGQGISAFVSFNTGPIGRIILGQVAGLFVMYDVFPDIHEYLGFSSISQFLSGVWGGEYSERASRIAMEYFNPRGVADGEAGVMNTIFIGGAWANFGLTGVILSPLYIGFFIQTLYIVFLKLRKSPIVISLFAMFSVSLPVTGGFNDFIYSPKIIIATTLVLIIYVVSLFINQWADRLIANARLPKNASL